MPFDHEQNNNNLELDNLNDEKINDQQQIRLKHLQELVDLGLNPYEFFYLNKKYKGLFIAIKTYITTHLRVLIPQLWE